MSNATPYTVPKEPGRWRAITLAAVVHAALLGLLWFGVRWQNETPTAVEAEVWDTKTREAAPRPEPTPVEPEPLPKPAMREPAPVKMAVEKPVEKPVERADIALEQEKKRKLAERKAEEERKKAEAKLAAQREAEEKRVRQARAEQAEAQAKLKREAEAARHKEEEAKLAQKQAAEKAEKKKLADKKRAQELADQQVRDKARAEEMRRMTAAIGSGGSGEAPKSTGNNRADPSYSSKVAAKIKSNTIYNVPVDLEGNPAVEYIVDLLPDGSVRDVRKLKSSGLPGFDEAVQRAIGKSAPFPPDKSGSVPSSFRVTYKPKDLA